MIPKTIHYCWFGCNPKSELALKCINSWKKYCADYKLIEWNEDNFDISKAPLYVRQAYEARKWAFITDYVRLWAMTEFGGIYMDTDVEVIKPLDDFLHHRAFSGFENAMDIPTGIMACEKGFPLFRKLLEHYHSASFYNEDGTMDLTTNVVVITQLCLEKGLVQNDTYQVIDGFALYPQDVFCPVNYITKQLETTENTVTIHWFSGSWRDAAEWEKEKKRVKRVSLWHNIIHAPNSLAKTILGAERYEKIKAKLIRGK